MITKCKIGMTEFEFLDGEPYGTLVVWKADGDGHEITEFSREEWLALAHAFFPAEEVGRAFTEPEWRTIENALRLASYRMAEDDARKKCGALADRITNATTREGDPA